MVAQNDTQFCFFQKQQMSCRYLERFVTEAPTLPSINGLTYWLRYKDATSYYAERAISFSLTDEPR
jgi:hypothetical protein